MSTLGTMKAAIADSFVRTDLTSQIAFAISQAIRYHSPRPFWWTKDRSITFNTVASQTAYTVSDNANIPNIINLHAVLATNDSTGKYHLAPVPQDYLEVANASATSGRPYRYSFFGETLYIAPIPDDAYPLQLICDLPEAEPASDDEANNRWMTDAASLIFAEAKRYLAIHTLRNEEVAQDMEREVARELQNLMAESNRRQATDRIRGDDEPYYPRRYVTETSYGRRW